MRVSALGFAIALPLAAHAQVTPRDIPWYIAHPDVMQQTLTLCHRNTAYSGTPDCQNAERAADGVMASKYSRQAQQGVASFQDPAWWTANRFARAGVLEQCRRRAPGDELVFPYCRAASLSALQDTRR